MKKVLLSIILFCFFLRGSAHTHKISSIFLIKQGEVWNAQITASFSAYQYEMLKEMSVETIKDLKAEEVQKWISEHLSKNLTFYANEQKLEYGGSYVKLGHEIKVKFLLKNVPKVQYLTVENRSFLNSGSFHKSLFKVIMDNTPSERFYMTNENKYSLALKIDDTEVTYFSDKRIFNKLSESLFLIIGMLICIAIGIFVMFFTLKKKKTTELIV